MTDKAIFEGCYSDMKFMRGYKVARISVDIPLEYASKFIEAFGAPDGVNPVRVAIARLQIGPDAAADRDTSGDSPQAEAQGQDKPRTHFKDMKRSQQAALRCQDIEFQQWIGCKDTIAPLAPETPSSDADYYLKERLGITSKRELDTNPEKADAWDCLVATFDTRHYQR